MSRISTPFLMPARLLIAAVIGIAVAACDSPSGSGGKVPAAVTGVSAAQQTAVAGGVVSDPPRVKVADANGNPVAGATVAWEVVLGGGQVNPATSATDTNGIATTNWMLGTTVNAEQVVRARVGTLNPVQFAATATTGTVAPQKVSGDNQPSSVTTPLPQPLVVKVALADGRPLAGAAVWWSVVSDANHPGTATVNTGPTFTDANGLAFANVGLGTRAGSVLVRALVASNHPQAPSAADTARAVYFNETATPLSPHFISVFNAVPAQTTVGAAVPLSAIVKDFYGNLVPNTMVEFDVVDGSGSVSPAVIATGNDGVASTQWKIGALGGTQKVVMSAPLITPAHVSIFATGTLNAEIGYPVADDPVLGDNVQLRIRLTGADTPLVESVSADVGGRSAPLTRTSSDLFGVHTEFYDGSLNLAGFPNGNFFVTYTVNLLDGTKLTTRRRFIHQSP